MSAMAAIAEHMHLTLLPTPETQALFAGKLAADRDGTRVAGYSILSISSETNDCIDSIWVGDEVVFDPGLTFETRNAALDACEVLESEGAQCTAFVVHYTDGEAAVFINPQPFR